MDKLLIRNFRCFREPIPVPLAPLTLLVGENSTGKSTFLAATRIAWDLAFGIRPLNFNDDPFGLGSYDEIAHNHGGQIGRANFFEIGFEQAVKVGRKSRQRRAYAEGTFKVLGTFTPGISEPELSRLELSYNQYRILIDLKESNNEANLTIYDGKKRFTDTIEKTIHGITFPRVVQEDLSMVFFMIGRKYWARDKKQVNLPSYVSDTIASVEHAHYKASQAAFGRPFAGVPIRTRPRRTYNPIVDVPEPEGSHVPMVLAKTHLESKKNWAHLKYQLEKFGKSSGFFNKINVKRLGKKGGQPFQLTVQIAGPASALIDVGYGVSQILPVLVDSIRGSSGQLFLLQQPEVHLHPKAQAVLGSFLRELASGRGQAFIVETHSDYLLDRIRMDVRDRKTLGANDVVILYFERCGADVETHRIRIDENGNLINVPSSYRDFFLSEDRRFLGVT